MLHSNKIRNHKKNILKKTKQNKMAKLSIFLTLALDGGDWSASCPSHFTPGETAPATHWIGHWVSLRASQDDLELKKIFPPTENQTPTLYNSVQRSTTERMRTRTESVVVDQNSGSRQSKELDCDLVYDFTCTEVK
jgi:hypothetical protein